MANVSLIKGKDRRESTRESLEFISRDIKASLKPGNMIIKPNFVSTKRQLASSHVDQVRGILDFFKEFYDKKIMIAEAASPFLGGTAEGFRNFGYYDLAEEYNVELIDLNKGPFEMAPILDKEGRTIHVRVSGLLLDRDNYIISAARLKTHDTVVVTLSIKNILMGCIHTDDKVMVHQGHRHINLNLADLAGRVWPDLAIIDGLIGMEGNGPEHGTPIDAGVVISSTDPLAADRIGCEVMGVDFNSVGYLTYCAERRLGEAGLDNINIIGEELKECITPFRLHDSVKEQLEWR